MKKTIGFPIAFLFCLALFLPLLAGCGGPKKAAPLPVEEEKVGILDLEQAVKAHPKWQQIEEIDAQINLLHKELKQEIDSQGTQDQLAALRQEKMASRQAELDQRQQEWNREQEILWKGLDKKMQAKKQELEQSFQQKVEKIRQEKNKELEDYQKQLKLFYGPRIVNLQLKLNFSNLTEQERETKKEELSQLSKEQEEKYLAKQQAAEEDMGKQLETAKAAMMKELKSYQTQEEAKIKADLTAKHQSFQESSQKELALEDQEWQEHLTKQSQYSEARAQKVQIAEQKAKGLNQTKKQIYEEIIKDLKAIAAKIAKEQGLEAVLVNYRVNVLAEDITFLVINDLKGFK